MKKKRFVLSICILFFSVLLCAQQRAESLMIKLLSGETLSFMLDECPKITFSDTELIITSELYETSYPLADLNNYTFSFKDASGIKSVESGDDKVLQTENMISINGLNPQADIIVYSVNGIIVVSTVADKNGNATVNLSGLPHGVYIVKYGKKSTKICKK